MWIFSKDGFFSAVQKPHQKNTNMITVRSRDKKDLLNFLREVGLPRTEILMAAGTDYEYRVEVSKGTWSEYLKVLTEDINYDNFKHEIQLQNAERSRIYSDVWCNLLRISRQTLSRFYDERTYFNNNVLDLRKFKDTDRDFPERFNGHFDEGGIWHYNNGYFDRKGHWHNYSEKSKLRKSKKRLRDLRKSKKNL